MIIHERSYPSPTVDVASCAPGNTVVVSIAFFFEKKARKSPNAAAVKRKMLPPAAVTENVRALVVAPAPSLGSLAAVMQCSGHEISAAVGKLASQPPTVQSTSVPLVLADVSLSLTPSEQPPAPASTAEALVVPPPAGLPSTAEHPATTSAEPVENVVTGAVGTGPASSSPAPLARTTPEGIESMNSGGPTRTPSLPAPQVPTKKPAATSGTNPRGGCRMDTMSVPPDLSDEDMDTSASQPAQQAQNECRSTFGRGKKPPHRTTGPKQDSLT
ncbi:hypothetical protein HPB48_022498 [Haemaphysalis longicornis]|uniref:Uncharacterized protein n=1 Tax=Haemaphysalis longicornis TaxID=44386 RepID=A0A9J6FT76_HAELO|nr:hypothetical protein HPB48_022498 [Haemaphysalis longicornis]